MIEIRIGYDNIYNNCGEINPYGSAQWSTIYITEDFQNFYDTDGEKYYKNKLAPVIYDDKVQGLREQFQHQFKNIKNIDDLDTVKGLLYINVLNPDLPY